MEGPDSGGGTVCAAGGEYRSAGTSDPPGGRHDLWLGESVDRLLYRLRARKCTRIHCGEEARTSTRELYSRTESAELADTEDQLDASGVCGGHRLHATGRAEWSDSIYCIQGGYYWSGVCECRCSDRVAPVCYELPLWLFSDSRAVPRGSDRVHRAARNHRADQLEERSAARKIEVKSGDRAAGLLV